MSMMSGGGDFETPKRTDKYISPLMRRLDKESDIFKSPITPSGRRKIKQPLFSTPKTPSNQGRVTFDLSNISTGRGAYKGSPGITKLPKPKEKMYESADEVYHSCEVKIFQMENKNKIDAVFLTGLGLLAKM